MRKKIMLIVTVSVAFSIISWSFKSEAIETTQQNSFEEALQKFGLTEKMEAHGVPGVSFAVIKNGKLDWAKGFGLVQSGKPDKINTESMFSVGSVSKVGTAVITLKLWHEGKLDVDTDVNEYLKSWKIPNNQYTREKSVTLRRIMSHTAGLTVHGFADFNPGEALPTTVQILKGERPAKNYPIYVNIPIGSRFRYSGGGTTVEQMLIEDMTGKLFHEAANDILFSQLGMTRSTYENPVPSRVGNIAKAHNRRGQPVALPRGYQAMPETAASGLWTTPSDFSKLMIMLMEAYEGNNYYLKEEIVKDMMTPVSPSNYGLGPSIREKSGQLIFRHGGSNESYKAQFMGSINSKNGFVIFTNGADGDDLIGELIPVFEALLF